MILEIQAYSTVALILTLDKSITSMRKTLMIKLLINEGIEEPLKSFLDFRVCKWLLMPQSGKH